MKQSIQRSYELDEREIREAVLAWLKANNMPIPAYVGNTPTCTWTWDQAGIKVEWTDEDECD